MAFFSLSSPSCFVTLFLFYFPPTFWENLHTRWGGGGDMRRMVGGQTKYMYTCKRLVFLVSQVVFLITLFKSLPLSVYAHVDLYIQRAFVCVNVHVCGLSFFLLLLHIDVRYTG